jgi:hypothetical protein
MDAAGVLPGFGGVAVHDGWSPYWRYPKATHALCAAHLLRELEGVAEGAGQGWAAELGEWFTIACGQATLARDAGADRLAPAVLAGLTDRYDRILAAGRAANPLPPRPPGRRRRRRRSPAACLLGRLEAHRGEVLRFLVDLRVPPTNNLAERDIRMVKLQQKISARREAPRNRVEVKGLRHRACRSRPVKLGAARPGRRWEGWEQPRQRRDGPVLPDGPGPASKTGRCTRGTSGKAS